ncbi:MAG: hypothetical protein ACK59B_13650 [Alphaproteobacteria bacterium]
MINIAAHDEASRQRDHLFDEIHKATVLSLPDRSREIREFIDKRCPLHGLDRVHGTVAPVAFHKAKHFDLNADAPDVAVVVPALNEFGEIVDLVAFELSGDQRIAMFLGRRIIPCIGAQDLFEARHHPQHRVHVSSGIWPWLRNGCVGLLPIDWRFFHLLLHARRLGVTVSSVQEGNAIEALLQEALPKIPVFVRESDGPARVAA